MPFMIVTDPFVSLINSWPSYIFYEAISTLWVLPLSSFFSEELLIWHVSTYHQYLVSSEATIISQSAQQSPSSTRRSHRVSMSTRCYQQQNFQSWDYVPQLPNYQDISTWITGILLHTEEIVNIEFLGLQTDNHLLWMYNTITLFLS